MANHYFQFLTAFIIFLAGIQEGLLVPSAGNNNKNINQMIDVGVLLNRLDQLETNQEALVNLVNQHELKINSQQVEIDQLKQKNLELEKGTNNRELIKTSDDVAIRDFLPRSCYEIKATNPGSQSGVYSIDPDGQIGSDQPIQVYCDMTTQTTSIYHDTEAKTDVTSCPDPGCYTKAITYSATMRQMMNLADISASCRQYFRFDSFVVPLEYNSTQYGYWNDRNGGKQIFWAGPATSQHTCQCGIENNCVERSFKCNADSMAPFDLVDEGFITATELLPVTRLSFGRTSLNGVKASYTLGRFECTGQAAISSKPTNCQDLFKIGHTLSGFYDVKGSSNQIASTYCDFSKSPTETGYETRYGFVDVKSSPVRFFVVRTSSWTTPGRMPFEKEYLNLGGGMNINSGVFTAPKAGTYAFFFKGDGAGTGSGYAGYGDVHLERNGADIAQGYSQINGATGGYSTLSVHAVLKLNQGDTITIRFIAGVIFSGGTYDIHFTGSLLEEDLVIT